jgi:hypothetical protein
VQRPKNGLRWRFVAQLQREILARNIDVRKLAEATGLNYSTLSSWVEGEHCPRLGDPARERVANALGRSLSWMNGTYDTYEHDIVEESQDSGEASTDAAGPEDRDE